MLYYTILYYTILYYTILYYTILYYTILLYTITILYYTTLRYTILYYTILYYTRCGEVPPDQAVEPGVEGWDVTSGPCVKTDDGCITSQNYPEQYTLPDGYSRSEDGVYCEISVQQPMLGSVSAVSFHTERGFDWLIINGNKYHGTPQYGPQAVTPVESIYWSPADEFFPAGGWKLCPDPRPSPCGSDTGESFVDVGALTMVGPATKHDRTCVSGYTCTVDALRGQDLSDGDLLLLLDECGEPTVIPRFSSAGKVAGASASGGFATWGDGLTPTAAGGTYRLCWCTLGAASCSTPEQFRVDAGQLTLIGLSPLTQDRTCISGKACTIRGFLGEEVGPDFSVMVLDTCGTVVALQQESPNIGRFVQSLLGTTGQAFSWGVTPLTVAGGNYRLCWCMALENPSGAVAHPFSCSTSEQFRVDGGQLTLIGPANLDQSKTCVSGSICSITAILGYNPSENDRVMMLDTCGTDSLIPRSIADGRSVLNTVSSGSVVDWGNAYFTAAGGRYRMCWCTSAFDVTIQPLECAWPQDFNIDFGVFTLKGPAPLEQDRTCVSGQTCKIDGIVGVGLSSLDSMLVLDTCGMDTKVPRFAQEVLTARRAEADTGLLNTVLSVVWGSTPVTAAGGVYRLCWCGGNLI